MLAFGYTDPPVGGDPKFFGHSINEIDWNQSIPKIKVNEICLNGTCKTSWPPGLSLPVGCPSGQAIQNISANGVISCTASPNIRYINCRSEESSSCTLICTNNETILYVSGCGDGYDYLTAYSLKCNQYGSTGTGNASCTMRI